MEITQSEEQTETQTEKKEKNESNRRDLWDSINQSNLRIIGIPEGAERENGVENIFKEIMAETFPDLKKEIDIQVQEVQGVPNKITPNRSTPRHIIKMGKFKERILKAAREKRRFNYKVLGSLEDGDRHPPTLQMWLFTLETCCGHTFLECGCSNWAARNNDLQKTTACID